MRKMNAGRQYCNWLLFYIAAFLLTGLTAHEFNNVRAVR
jgi:hypothetical protein